MAVICGKVAVICGLIALPSLCNYKGGDLASGTTEEQAEFIGRLTKWEGTRRAKVRWVSPTGSKAQAKKEAAIQKPKARKHHTG